MQGARARSRGSTCVGPGVLKLPAPYEVGVACVQYMHGIRFALVSTGSTFKETCTCTHARACTHAFTHTHWHTHTRTHTCKHINTHTNYLPLARSVPDTLCAREHRLAH